MRNKYIKPESGLEEGSNKIVNDKPDSGFCFLGSFSSEEKYKRSLNSALRVFQ